MPIITTVNEDRQLTINIVAGEVTFDELMTVIKGFWEKSPTPNLLWDFREGALAGVGQKEIDIITNYISIRGKPGKSAFVASGDLDYGVSRMISTHGQMKNSPRTSNTFRSMSEAIKWLDSDI